MPRRPDDDAPLPTVADAKARCPGGVRVWCHAVGCPRQDAMVLVPWDKIRAPDSMPFIEMKFRCTACGEARTTFMPDWPHVEGQGRAPRG